MAASYSRRRRFWAWRIGARTAPAAGLFLLPGRATTASHNRGCSYQLVFSLSLRVLPMATDAAASMTQPGISTGHGIDLATASAIARIGLGKASRGNGTAGAASWSGAGWSQVVSADSRGWRAARN